ncbi:DUF916 domain-containing protein [Patescibacteria group bacterium]|nr:DUF916 domain-containing protein [Patescibacteria group bacterium]
MKSNQVKQFFCQTEKNNFRPLLLLMAFMFLLFPLFLANAQENKEQEKQLIAKGILQAEILPANPQTEKLDLFYYEIEPGASKIDSFYLINTSDGNNTVRIYPTYSFTNDKGTVIYSMENDEKKEISKWITIEEANYTLNPKEERKVPMKIEIPEDTPLGTYKGGFAIEKTDNTVKNGIKNAFRKISKIEINVTDNPKEFIEKPIKFQPTILFWSILAFFILSLAYYLFSLFSQKKKAK